MNLKSYQTELDNGSKFISKKFIPSVEMLFMLFYYVSRILLN